MRRLWRVKGLEGENRERRTRLRRPRPRRAFGLGARHGCRARHWWPGRSGPSRRAAGSPWRGRARQSRSGHAWSRRGRQGSPWMTHGFIRISRAHSPPRGASRIFPAILGAGLDLAALGALLLPPGARSRRAAAVGVDRLGGCAWHHHIGRPRAGHGDGGGRVGARAAGAPARVRGPGRTIGGRRDADEMASGLGGGLGGGTDLVALLALVVFLGAARGVRPLALGVFGGLAVAVARKVSR